MNMADMSEMLKNFSSMLEGQEIPDNIKELLNSVKNDDKSSDSKKQDTPNIDMDTLLKMQKIMSAMNNSSNSSSANLLRSLKPYLKPSRQAKVDECIQLLNMEKVMELMKQSDGGSKHDT